MEAQTRMDQQNSLASFNPIHSMDSLFLCFTPNLALHFLVSVMLSLLLAIVAYTSVFLLATIDDGNGDDDDDDDDDDDCTSGDMNFRATKCLLLSFFFFHF